jgi:hypothetical protein
MVASANHEDKTMVLGFAKEETIKLSMYDKNKPCPHKWQESSQ